MTLDIFHAPVRILVGLGFPRDIRSALDAVAYLDDVPEQARNSAYTMALRACKAALAGEIEAETARGTFVAYAHKQDILAPLTEDLVAATSMKRFEPRTF